MGTSANPLFGAPNAPGGGGPVYGGGTSTTNNPYLPAIPYGTTGQASGAAGNPYSTFLAYGAPAAPPSQVGTPATGGVGSVAGGGVSPTGIPQAGAPLNPAEQNSLNISLGKTYGQGLGGLIEQFLSSGAGYNPQVLQALVAQLQPTFEQN